MSVHFNPPSALHGAERDRIANLYSYLHQMAEQLNVALRSLNADNFADPDVRQLVSSAGSVSTAAQTQNGYNELKSLIILSADAVQASADALILNLQSEYEAVSETLGTFEEDIDNRIRLGADGLLTEYNYHSMITGAQEYINESNQYLKAGLLFFDDYGQPKYGFAVGDTLTTQTVDGVTTVLRQGLAATFTADRLSFWQNEVEVAWVSDNQLYINEIALVNKMTIGDKWLISHDNGYTIKWIGA